VQLVRLPGYSTLSYAARACAGRLFCIACDTTALLPRPPVNTTPRYSIPGGLESNATLCWLRLPSNLPGASSAAWRPPPGNFLPPPHLVPAWLPYRIRTHKHRTPYLHETRVRAYGFTCLVADVPFLKQRLHSFKETFLARRAFHLPPATTRVTFNIVLRSTTLAHADTGSASAACAPHTLPYCACHATHRTLPLPPPLQHCAHIHTPPTHTGTLLYTTLFLHTPLLLPSHKHTHFSTHATLHAACHTVHAPFFVLPAFSYPHTAETHIWCLVALFQSGWFSLTCPLCWTNNLAVGSYPFSDHIQPILIILCIMPIIPHAPLH